MYAQDIVSVPVSVPVYTAPAVVHSSRVYAGNLAFDPTYTSAYGYGSAYDYGYGVASPYYSGYYGNGWW